MIHVHQMIDENHNYLQEENEESQLPKDSRKKMKNLRIPSRNPNERMTCKPSEMIKLRSMV